MITVDGYNLYYTTDHLLTPKPKDYQEVIERLKTINSKLFYNVISSPACNYEKKFSEGRIDETYRTMDPESRFRNIFINKVLFANPKGYFVNKLKSEPRNCREIKSVSFTLCEHTELYKHFNRRGSDYGICFFHDFLQDRGLRPVTYLNDNDIQTISRFVFNSPHLLEVYRDEYDMRWENEWRIKNDLHFTEDDVAFVVVPNEKVNFYIDWFQGNDEFQTVQVISVNAYRSVLDHLIQYPQQNNNSWRQVEVFSDKTGPGFKLSPEDFNNIDVGKKNAFAQTIDSDLQLFSKGVILSNYEHAYMNRYLRFENQLANPAILDELFPGRQEISGNKYEPEDTLHDLIKRLFGLLYEAFPIYKEDY